MKKLLTYTCTLLSATALYAESTWFATVEVDSLQALQMGIESFCKAAELPIPTEDLAQATPELLKNVLPLSSPNTAISFKDPIRVFFIEDSKEPLHEGGEPALLFSLTLAADTKVIQDQLSKLYGARRDGGNVITFSDPKEDDTDLDLPETVLLSIGERNKALLATSQEALTWFQKQQKLDAFLPVAGNQTIKACFNLKALQGILDDFPMMPGGEKNPVAAILNDIEYLSIAVTPNAQALTWSYGVRAKTGTVIATLLNAVKPPPAVLWNGLPENALFGYVGQQEFMEDQAKIWETYFGQAFPLNDAIQTKLEKAYTRDLIRYIAPTADKKAFRMIDLNPLKDADAVATAKELIKTLDQSEMGFKLKKEPSREIGGVTVERYSMTVDAAGLGRMAGLNPAMLAPGGDPATGPMLVILSALAKGIVLECTVKDNYFISAICPADATDNWLPTLPFPTPTVTLDKRIGVLDPTAKPMLSAAEMNVTPLLKQLISMMPNVKPEHLALFSAKTDAVQLWSSRTTDNTTLITIRVPANEVASIVKIVQNGQAVLQELVTTFFMTRMMPLMMQQQQPGGPAMQPPPNF